MGQPETAQQYLSTDKRTTWGMPMTAEQGISQLEGESEPTDRQKDVGRWVVFVVVSVALLMGSIDATIVATALPTLHKALPLPLRLAAVTRELCSRMFSTGSSLSS